MRHVQGSIWARYETAISLFHVFKLYYICMSYVSLYSFLIRSSFLSDTVVYLLLSCTESLVLPIVKACISKDVAYTIM